jgi:hypothetical protein
MVLMQTRERIIVERDITLELPMQVATSMVLRTLGLLCYTTSSQSSLRPSLRAICGNRLRQGRRNASNPRCACAVAVGCGLGRRFCGQASVIDGDTLEIHGTRIRLLGDRCTGKTASYAAARTALDTTAARWPQTTSTPSSPGARSAAFRMARAQPPCVGLASILQRQVWRLAHATQRISGVPLTGALATPRRWRGEDDSR